MDGGKGDEAVAKFQIPDMLAGRSQRDVLMLICVAAQLTRFNDGLKAIKDGISAAGQSYSRPPTLADPTVQQLRQLIEGLRAVPVQVDIKVVPVQDEKGSIEKMDAPDSPALEFKPEVNQG